MIPVNLLADSPNYGPMSRKYNTVLFRPKDVILTQKNREKPVKTVLVLVGGPPMPDNITRSYDGTVPLDYIYR